MSHLTNSLISSRKVNKAGSPYFSSKAFNMINEDLTPKIINCSKFIIETLKKFNTKNTITMPDVVVSLFFRVSVVDFGQINVCIVLKKN